MQLVFSLTFSKMQEMPTKYLMQQLKPLVKQTCFLVKYKVFNIYTYITTNNKNNLHLGWHFRVITQYLNLRQNLKIQIDFVFSVCKYISCKFKFSSVA